MGESRGVMDTNSIVKISELKNWEQNPRSISEKDFERLKKQIQKLGQYKPLIVNQDNIVLGGNMRLRALVDLGIEDVWINRVTTKDEAEMIEYALSDNDRAGEYNEEQLAELATLHPIDLELYHVDLGKATPLPDLVDKYGPEAEEDEPPEVDESNVVSKLGEVYQLGKHRVMCGDSTKDLEQLMDGKKANLLLTDPPYGVSYADKNEFLNSIARGNRNQDPIENDHKTPEEMKEFWTEAFGHIFLFLEDNASYYVCSPQGGELLLLLLSALYDIGYPSRHMIIWNKNNHVLGRSDYNYKHEPLLYGWKETHIFYGGGKRNTSVWEVDKPHQSKEHPTMKPVELMAEAIKNSSKKNDIVLDTFLGSGSTLVACEQTDRICYGMEIDPKYVDVIRKRYAKFIGKEEEWEKVTPKV